MNLPKNLNISEHILQNCNQCKRKQIHWILKPDLLNFPGKRTSDLISKKEQIKMNVQSTLIRNLSQRLCCIPLINLAQIHVQQGSFHLQAMNCNNIYIYIYICCCFSTHCRTKHFLSKWCYKEGNNVARQQVSCLQHVSLYSFGGMNVSIVLFMVQFLPHIVHSFASHVVFVSYFFLFALLGVKFSVWLGDSIIYVVSLSTIIREKCYHFPPPTPPCPTPPPEYLTWIQAKVSKWQVA